MKHIALDIVCQPCNGTGLYVGLAERGGAAVVCHTCKGTGKDAYRFEYEPFEQRRPTPPHVTRVHLARGYILDDQHPECDGGIAVAEYRPGMVVPADETLYCPYLYTSQQWCAQPEPSTWDSTPRAPITAGRYISDCPKWSDKATCWQIFHESAPAEVRRQIS